MRVSWLFFLLCAGCTCFEPVPEGFDGGADSGRNTRDSGALDAGGTFDAGTSDSGTPDAGAEPDAGTPDAGVRRGIEIISAIYGSNCGLTASNDLRIVNLCSGDLTCEYRVDVGYLGDTAPGCNKAYTVTYRCEPGGPVFTARQSAESTGKLVFLDCASPAGDLRVENATYGGNCPQAPIGNAWWSVAGGCNGKTTCSYLVHHTVLGEPAFGCAKAFSVEWSCTGSTVPHVFNIPAEADGQTASLTCP